MIGLKMKKQMKDQETPNQTISAGQLQFKKGILFYI